MAERYRAMTKQDVLSAIDREWNAWLAELARVPAERRETPVVGDWSVKDLVGHVALWDTQVLEDISRHLRGLPPLENDDTQQRNDTAWARNRSRGSDELEQEMHAAHARMLDAIGQASGVDAEQVAVDTWEHYAEHGDELRRSFAGTDG